MRASKMLSVAAVLLLVTLVQGLNGAVVRIEIHRRTPFADGKHFGEIGPYEQILATVHYEVDPKHPANKSIVDLAHAPQNAQGKVSFSADLEILAPADLNRARETLFYEINNRGRRRCLHIFNEHADHFLMRRGYIVVWSGWLAEVSPFPEPDAPQSQLLRLDAPIATQEGAPLTGQCRAEVVVDEPAPRMVLSGRPWIGSHPPVKEKLPDAVLTWRLRERDPRVEISRAQWRLHTKPVEASGHRHCLPLVELEVSGGLRPGYLYELIYAAHSPVVQGLGLAAIRDLISFFKHDTSPNNPLCTQGKVVASRAIGFGISQSGRALRSILYEGFNADDAGRRVFDGMLVHLSGAGQVPFYRFCSPSRYASQHTDHLFPCDLFPFTYGDQRDPHSGQTDGLLRPARQAGVVPKIFHVQNSAEYWHRAGSLVHTDPLGSRDSQVPPEVRLYSIGGAQHHWGDDGPPEDNPATQLPENPTDYRPNLRALLVALDAWVTDDTQPPPSVYPRIDQQTLAPWPEKKSSWQALPGVRYPEVINQPARLDFGPEFISHGRVTQIPPRRLESYRVLIPRYDGTNHEPGMLLLPPVAVPTATFTGWNLRSRRIGAENELLQIKGGTIPLCRTRSERIARGDPRPALLERYRDFEDYLAQYEAAVKQLVASRYLLAEDVPLLHSRARANRRLFEPEAP